MISRTQRNFWICFRKLPEKIQPLAIEKFNKWSKDPFHPSLHFKELYAGLWSVRLNRSYRALARRKGDQVVWFWIGTHQEYDRMVHPK